MKTINGTLFETLVHLEEVDLSENELTYANFNKLTNLKTINLSSNQLINANIFNLSSSSLNNLTEINLSSNQITKLEESECFGT